MFKIKYVRMYSNCPKKVFQSDIMEYNPFQHQAQTNSEAQHAQEFTHMNNIVFLLHSNLK